MHERVTALFGGPAMHPGAPRAVAAERVGDLAVVAGQVVLGQQVDLEGDLGDRGEGRLARLPRQLVEIAALAPRHVLVRHPLLGEPQVALEPGLGKRLQLAKKLEVRKVCLVSGNAHEPMVRDSSD